MSDVLSGVGCSLLASIIYDIAKVYLFREGKSKLSKRDITTMIQESLGDKYEVILMSGRLISFLETSAFKDTIENFIIYKATGHYNGAIRQIKKSDSVVKEKDVIEFLSSSFVKEFDDVCVQKPTKQELEKFFGDYFKVSAEYFFSLLSDKERLEVVLINGRIDSATERLLLRFKETIEIINRTMRCDIIPQEDGYDESVGKYHRKLKANNSMAHIYLLDTFDFAEFYVPPILVNKSNDDHIHEFYIENKRFYIDVLKSGVVETHNPYVVEAHNPYDDWKYIFDKTNIVYVTGGAGYGKSLFLKKIINDFEQMNILNCTEYLVIYGDLKTFFVEGDNPISVIKFLQNSMVNESLMDQTDFPCEMIKRYLQRGRCLILLDALDEVEKSKREELYKKIISFFKDENPNNRICITSRNRGFIPKKDVEVYDIAKLDGDQIEKYVDNIIKLGKFAVKDKEPFLEQARVLVNKGFLNSFLVLSLLINIYKAERELPENKMELYQKCFDYIAYKREKEKTKARFDWGLISCMMKDNTFMELAKLCFPNNSDIGKDEIIDMLCKTYGKKYTSEAETEKAADNFIAFCSDRTELFVPAAGEDRFRFFHRSFFEYFYAQYIFVRIRNVEEVYDSLQKFDVDSEVFELTLAMMKQKDEWRYQELIDYIFQKAELEFQDGNDAFTGFNTLTLGMQVIDDDAYMRKYVDILTNNSEFISRHIRDIPNQRIIENVISRNDELVQMVIDAFGEDVKYRIVDFVRGLFFDNRKGINDLGRAFYDRLYLRNNGLKNIIEGLQEDELIDILKKKEVSKRKRSKYLKEFNRWKREERREKLLELEHIVMNLIDNKRLDKPILSSLNIAYYGNSDGE